MFTFLLLNECCAYIKGPVHEILVLIAKASSKDSGETSVSLEPSL